MDVLENFLKEEQEELRELIPDNTKLMVVMDKEVDKSVYERVREE
jgi:hypothetical protein